MPVPPLSPVPEDRARYPSLSEFGTSRRRFLKLAALSGAAATLGLPLVGCPDKNSGGGGGDDWVPWDDHERLAGAMPMPMGEPVAVVIGGGPVSVTFSDGVQADLVVAGVFTPYDGFQPNPAADFAQGAEAHAKTVQEQAAGQPSSVLRDAAALEALEAAIRDAINASLQGGYIEEASIAEARKAKQVAQSQARSQADEAPGAMAPARAPAAPPAGAEAAAASAEPAAPAAEPTRSKQAFRRIWTPCRRDGCTNCS